MLVLLADLGLGQEAADGGVVDEDVAAVGGAGDGADTLRHNLGRQVLGPARTAEAVAALQARHRHGRQRRQADLPHVNDTATINHHTHQCRPGCFRGRPFSSSSLVSYRIVQFFGFFFQFFFWYRMLPLKRQS